MDRMIEVTFKDETRKFLVGTSLYEVSKAFQKHYNYAILAACIDGEIINLNNELTKKCNIDFFDRSSSVGNTVYNSSLHLMMIVAIRRVLGNSVEVRIEHSIDRGVYCELINHELNRVNLEKIEDEMYRMVKDDSKFTRIAVSRLDAIKFFKKDKRIDKVNVLKYNTNTFVNLYRLDDYYDYFFTEMAYSTKDIDSFKLTFIKGSGFVLSSPNIYNPECTLDYVHHRGVFDKFLSYTTWGQRIGVTSAADLNEIVSVGKSAEIIRLAEANFESQLAMIASNINENRGNIKIVLLAGPSSSGKTTTTKKLAIYLQTHGFRTHQISIDNYFVDRDKTPVLPNGDYDFESLHAIDLNLFNKHLVKLMDGEKVTLPEYNFVLGKRQYNKKTLELLDNDIILIEGLHALNDELTAAVDRRNKYKIYLSPLTQLNIDNHNRIHTSDTRRLRRIIRDNKYRGRMAAETLKMWKNIREGEEKYIFPFQDQADIVLNTALVYELGVLKTYAAPLLFSVREDDPVYPEAIRLINFLKNFLSIPSDQIPSDSILREFIGGSGFNE